MKIRFLYFISMILFSVSVMAQYTTISGNVTFSDKQAVIGANVSLKGTSKLVVTDTKGHYELNDVSPGDYSLVVSYVGYTPQRKQIKVTADDKVEVQFVFTETTKELDEVTVLASSILGSKHAVLSRTGSGYYVSKEELEQFNHTDINRILANVPGVNMFEEDGFGLRPNISLRGASPGRTSKVTIMEDGVLAAPAPYASPAAYYFPAVGRMDAVEVLKGSSQIQYGPFTTGGAINLISTPIPTTLSTRLKTSYGSFNTSNLRATIGNSHKHFAYVVDYLKHRSDGFKEIENQKGKGFDRNDITAKLRLNTDLSKNTNHSLTLKFQYSDEDSDETYLGITEEDYKKSPFKRYAASSVDHLKTDHKQFTATYLLNINKQISINAIGYYNTFYRNWYRLDKVNIGENVPSLSTALDNPTKYAEIINVMRGLKDTEKSPLSVKANQREYVSKGIQIRSNYRFNITDIHNDIEVGVRLHEDEEDRFQHADKYDMVKSTMLLASKGIGGSDANQVNTAKAFAGYLLYKLSYGNLQLTPGLRYEHITIYQNDYGKKDPDRKGSELRKTDNKVGGTFIPGIGVNYRFSQELSAFGGVHRGFAPPGAKTDTKPENSTNYELGLRLMSGILYSEVVGFINQYTNLLGSDLAAAGGGGTLDIFNAGKVGVSGLEFILNYNLIPNNSKLKLPIQTSYTFTNTEFKNAFKSDIWGEVKEGDEIPYISKHQLAFGIGLEYTKVSLMTNIRYNSGFRTKAGSGSIPETQKAGNSLIVDVNSKYSINKNIGLSLSMINLFDKRYIASRTPSGVRPGMPRGIYAGLSIAY